MQNHTLNNQDALTFAFAAAGDSMVAAQIRARLAAQQPKVSRDLPLVARVLAAFGRRGA